MCEIDTSLLEVLGDAGVRHALYLLGRHPRTRAELHGALAGSRSSVDRRIRTLKAHALVVSCNGRFQLDRERVGELSRLLRELLGEEDRTR